jgi:hypothetical protein
MMIKCVESNGDITYLNRDRIIYVDDRGGEYRVQLTNEFSVHLDKHRNGEMTCFLENRTYRTDF